MVAKRVGLSILSGVLFGAPFLMGALWPMALLGIVPLLFTLRNATVGRTFFLYGWLASFALSLLALAPIFWGTLPLDWYGFSAVWIEWFAVGFSWLLTSAVLALSGGLFGLLFFWYGTHTWRDTLIVPSAWVIAEWAGAYLFSVIAIGPGSLIGGNFTLTYVGYALANDLVFLQLARFGDVYALSFAAVAIGATVYRIIVASERERRILYICVALLAAAWPSLHLGLPHIIARYSGAGEATSSLSVVAISRYAPPLLTSSDQEEQDRFNALRALVKPIRNADVIVFPENAVYLRTIMQTGNTTALHELEKTGSEKPPLIIDSEDIRQENNELFSMLTYFGSDGGIVFSYKEFLLPLGEYFPDVYRGLVAAVGGEGLLEKVLNVRGYAAGPYANIAFRNGVALGARFCDEVMSPELYEAQVKAGANVLVNLSSQSWFHGSHLVYEEMKQIARVRAVSLGRWYVQSGNMAPAFALNEYGQLVAETPWDAMTIIEVHVPSLRATTPASWMGDYVLLIPLVLLGVLSSKKRQTSRDTVGS